MAEVFLARDQLLDRPVAVKVLFPEFANDPSFVERFRREANAAANLNHPNIVGVYDWGEADGTYFIVMEYVDGRTLSEILRTEGPLHPDRVADVGADVAAALGFAHRNGVVHRDVKPGNVLVDRRRPGEGRRLRHRPGHHENADENLTQAGTVMGTAAYFSPEQARGDAVDPRSDIYSLGCVLYELVLGRPPFSGDTPVAIAYKHVQETPTPPRQINPGCRRPSRRSSSSAWPRTRSTATRRPRTCGPTSAASGRAPASWPSRSWPLRSTRAPPRSSRPLADAHHRGARRPRRGGRRRGPPRRAGSSSPSSCCSALLAGMLFLLARALGLDEDDDSVPQVEVPDVVDQPDAEAQTILEDEGLEVEIVEEPNDDAEAGIVFDQDPRWARRSTRAPRSQLQVSQGAEADVRCPTWSGRTSRGGRGAAHRAGVHGDGRDDAPTRTPPSDEVIDQRPGGRGGGTARAPRSASRSRADRRARRCPTSPACRPAEASNLLGQAGFTVRQTRRGGQRVDEGRSSAPIRPPGSTQPRRHGHPRGLERPGRAARPDVVGLTEANAITTLQGAGFTADVSEQDTTDDDRGRPGDPPGPRGQHQRRGRVARSTITVGRFVAPTDDGDGRRLRRRRRRARLGEEVPQEVVPAGGEDRLGVELHALDARARGGAGPSRSRRRSRR